LASRKTSGFYADPVDLIWLSLAKKLGFRIHRSDEAYASFDGEHVLTICTPAEFDEDDCLAQMILHELCHALVGGDKALKTRDWGITSEGEDDLLQEHATHRLQAYLSGVYGLQDMLAVTTEWRSHYDVLGEEPLKGEEPSVSMAQKGLENARAWRWESPIQRAMKATAEIAKITRPFTDERSLWNSSQPLHPSGFPYDGNNACGKCAWAMVEATGVGLLCQQSNNGKGLLVPVEADSPSCLRFEERFDAEECSRCGACCREGFDAVPVGEDEPLFKARPDLLAGEGDFIFIPRPDGKCRVLKTDSQKRWRCAIYDERPRACVDLEMGSIGCLQARRRVGLSRG
jgi:hypothetical protein